PDPAGPTICRRARIALQPASLIRKGQRTGRGYVTRTAMQGSAGVVPRADDDAAGRKHLRPLQRVPELLAELSGEVFVVEALVLRAGVLDLQRAHQVADAADGLPVAALLDAEDQAGAERVAAAGRVGDPALVGRRDGVGLPGRVDQRAA